jgi:hypothetical protein
VGAKRPTMLIVGVSLGAITTLGLTIASSTTAQPTTIPSGTTGAALAEGLDLELVDGFFAGCYYYVEVEESGAGYCLDDVVTTDEQAWDIGQRLRGHIPTDLERDVFRLEVERSEASEAGDTDRVEELDQQLAVLWPQVQAAAE